jgi:meiotic recombination protein DMC1
VAQVLLNIKGISEAKLEKVVEAARKLLPTGFMSGVDALSQLQNRLHITTGAKELDTLLGGGVETKIITELFGEYRTGKSELCAMLAVTAQLGVEHGGGAGKVIILSTDASFRVDRIADIAEKRFGLNRTEVLENIAVATILNHEHQLELTKMVYAKIVDDEMPTRLIIVDSVIDHFRTEFSGRGELAERQQKLGPHLWVPTQQWISR